MPGRSQREAVADLGFPLFGVVGDGFVREVGGHGWWGGGERQVVLRHERPGVRVEVETIVGRTRDQEQFRADRGVVKWAVLRHPFPETLSVELRAGPVDVLVDGEPVEMWSLGDDEVWFVIGQVGDRHVEVHARGLPLPELALVRLGSLEGYELGDEPTQ